MSKNKKRKNNNSFDQRLFYQANKSFNNPTPIASVSSGYEAQNDTADTQELLSLIDDSPISTGLTTSNITDASNYTANPTDHKADVVNNIPEDDPLEPTNFDVSFQVSPRPVVVQKVETDTMQLLIRGYGPK